MKCESCGSKIPNGSNKCPRCGASLGDESAIPAPSPYYKEIMPADPALPAEPVKDSAVEENPVSLPTAPTPPAQVIPVKSAVVDRARLALIAFIIGLAGIPLNLLLAGCLAPANIIGIILAWMGLKSDRRGLSIAALLLNAGTVIIVVLFYILVGLIMFDVVPV